MALDCANVTFLSEDNEQFAQRIVVGHRFLFLNSDAVAALSGEFDKLTESVVGNRAIVAIPEEGQVSIGGIQFDSPLVESISWLSLTCDRMVYDELNDPINFLVVAPDSKNESVDIAILESGKEVENRDVRLNSAGVGSFSVLGMPVGEYEAVINSGSGHQACQFAVARYRLAALVAELEQFRMLEATNEGVDRTEVEMTLRTFGVPYSGSIRCDLVEQGKVLISKTVEVDSGSVTVVFPFQGTKSLSVNVQACDDPSKTATVILQGSSRKDRDAVTFSNFGKRLTG